MKANFLKSITTGIVGLTLLGGCSHFTKKEDANKCSSKNSEKNGCKGKKDAHSCSGKKDAHSCKAKKDTNKAKKDAAAPQAAPATTKAK